MREKCEKNDFLISYLRLWQYYERLDESNSVLNLKNLETWQRYWFTQILNLSVSQGSENWKWTILNFQKYHDTLKVALSQKGLMRLSFLRTGKPNYFPELKFWILFPSKWLKSCQKRTLSSSEWSKKALEQLKVLFWHYLSHLEGKRIQNFSSGK